MIPAEWYESIAWNPHIPWDNLSDETKEYYIIEYSKRFPIGCPTSRMADLDEGD